MNVLSLFDGISCGQVALNRAGIDIENYYASEIDINACKITQANFPNTIPLGDVCKIKSEELGRIDLLMGGSPCQSFSYANTKSRTGLEGKSKLFWEFIRILKEVKPKYFLLENVIMKPEWEAIITKEIGVNPVYINSADFSAQIRKRLYWTNIPILKWRRKGILFKDILENWNGPWLELNDNQLRKLFHIDPSIEKSNALTQAQSRKGSSSEYLTMISKIKKAQQAEGYRALTPTECERLQTLPDGYTKVDGVFNSRRMNAIGNGWTVDVIAHIFKGLNKELVEKEESENLFIIGE
ncbi:MAG: DNA (cytosine-5-)-methyltransferase [Candidatus Cloacimonetes bacterium]|jgi:DNA (cytosine-5)-methyltransferase 3A|nr:DNA (cytosine-5-)-methyltransferase [Candidatus Cloacimonadota bacterium]